MASPPSTPLTTSRQQHGLDSPQAQQQQQQPSLFDRLGTIGRKSRKAKEVEDLHLEGKEAIDGTLINPAIEALPEDFLLDEYEERSMIEPSEVTNNKEFANLVSILVNWINDELSEERIIVRKLYEDLFDGQILGKLIEKLSGQKLDIIEVTQNEDLQRHKLRAVLDTINRLLGLGPRFTGIKWNVDGIHHKHLIQIIHLLVTLIRHYRAPIRLPANVSVLMVVVQKRDGHLHTRSVSEVLTGTYDELGLRIEPRDAFDTLFDHAPDKLAIVKQSLVNFVNRHLNRINIECYSGHSGLDLDPQQFSDGLLLLFLMGMLEGYFVPLGNIFTTTTDPLETLNSPKETALSRDNYVNTSPIHKLHNVQVAFGLMEDAGIAVRAKVRAEDITNGDLKSVLRVLYMVFNKYKHF